MHYNVTHYDVKDYNVIRPIVTQYYVTRYDVIVHNVMRPYSDAVQLYTL